MGTHAEVAARLEQKTDFRLRRSTNRRQEPGHHRVSGEGEDGDGCLRKQIRSTRRKLARQGGRPWNPGLVIYAHADGAFSVWDPARNYWKKKGSIDVQDRLAGYVFSAKEVWNGLEVEIDGKETIVCNGLLRDWASWIREKNPSAENMRQILLGLSPAHDETDKLEPGPPMRLSITNVRDIPTLKTRYSKPIPILHASSGVRRIVALAYMLEWSCIEHRLASEQLGEPPAAQVVLLIDELESHLHPRWQRSILGSLLKLAAFLHENAKIQLITATHSPLVLASAEPTFDPEKDAWFDLDLKETSSGAQVQLVKRDFLRHGDISNWLTSEAFDLKEARFDRRGESRPTGARATKGERSAHSD